jgi:hypothetical protein
MVLETLLESFTQFKLNYNMNKMNVTLLELMMELQTVEKIMKPKSTVLLPKASSSETKPKAKKFRKKRGDAVRLVGIGPNA